MSVCSKSILPHMPKVQTGFLQSRKKITVVPRQLFDYLKRVANEGMIAPSRKKIRIFENEKIETLSHRRIFINDIIREMKEYKISNKENFCYECGSIINMYKHFCTKECAERFFQRYGEKEGIKEIKKQTEYRKNNKLPCHQLDPIEAFLRYGKITGPSRLQELLRLITQKDKNNNIYFQWLLEIKHKLNKSAP